MYVDCVSGRQFAWVAGKDFGSEVKALLLKIEVPKPYTLDRGEYLL